MGASAWEPGLDRNTANYTALTPVSCLAKAAHVYPERTAVIHGAVRRTWREVYERSRRLASALVRRGIKRGDTVAAMLPNVPAMVELHFGPAMLGAVLNALNTRLDAEAIAFMLDHGEAKVLFTDREFSAIVAKALKLAESKPLVVDVDDALYDGAGEGRGSIEYEDFIAQGDANFEWKVPPDEWNAIALNYTSGTTGNPKGVVYHYRGAYLNALNNILDWSMPKHPVYLWTLPMFHCNGWCFNWTIAAAAGTNVCLRKVEAKLILELIREHRVTHYCGAPIVHSMLLNAPAESRKGIDHAVHCLVAAAPPPAALIEGMAKIGFDITHVYGLTETYGPPAVRAQPPAGGSLPGGDQGKLNGRQGVDCLLP